MNNPSEEQSEGYQGIVDHQEQLEVLLATTRTLLAAGDTNALRLILNDQHHADLAELFKQLEENQRQQALEVLAGSLAAGLLVELDRPVRLELAQGLDVEGLSDLVEKMEPDDAADFLAELSEQQGQQVLELMEVPEAREVRQLLQYPEDSAGGIMNSRLVAVSVESTVRQAVDRLRVWEDDKEIFHLYAVDEGGRLVGTVSLKQLLLATADTPISQVADRDAISVGVGWDQEEIARVFGAYDLMALPVVASDGILVGQVTVDDIVDVIEEEATEDILEMAAVGASGLSHHSVIGSVRGRLPWLLVCLVGTLMSGGVIKYFEVPLDGMIKVLVLFAPAIMAMGGNSGIQTSTVTVRSLATGQLSASAIRGLVFQELRVALTMGILVGGLVFGAALVWTGQREVGICVGVAMGAAMVLSAALGACVPLIFRSLGIDPAVASGPLITTLNDVLSLSIYFTIAMYLLQEAA